MDLLKHYKLLIEKRQNQEPEGYTEVHHIVPRCLGGTDDPSNLVRLTPREHFVAHWMLSKIHPKESKIMYAFFCMIRDPHGYRMFSSHYYDRAKRCLSNQTRLNFLTNNPMWREDVVRKVSESKRGSNNPMYNCGANNNTAYPVTVVFQDGTEKQFSHGKSAYEELGMSRSTWIVGIRNNKFNKRWNIKEIIKDKK